MISCITLFRKKDTLSGAEFKRLWAEEHAPTCHGMDAMFGYEQNYVFLKEKGDAYSESIVADGFSIERYETLYDYEKTVASPEYKAWKDGEKAFADYSETYVCLENVSIPCRVQETCHKKISLLGRTVPQVSFEDYTREWLVIHSGCMVKMPTDVFYGYNQHLIIDRQLNGEHVPHETLPFDGILELFYSDAKEVANAFATTPEGQMTVSHRKEFMRSVDPFQVEYKVFK